MRFIREVKISHNDYEFRIQFKNDTSKINRRHSTVGLPSKTKQYLVFLTGPLQIVFPLRHILLYTEFIRKQTVQLQNYM